MRYQTEKFGINDKRGRQLTSQDPYLPERGLEEPAFCTLCHAVYRNKRWYLDDAGYDEVRGESKARSTTCPGCQKVQEKYAEGQVTLRGTYLWAHEEEIRNILQNEVEKARAKNPLERIIRMEREGDQLIIETTEEKLAEHLGRKLHRTHQGELHVTWDADHDFCRVTWERSH